MVTRPSDSRRRRASRTLLRLTPVALTMSASTRRCPGTRRPLRVRWRTHSTTWAGSVEGDAASALRGAGLRMREGVLADERGMMAQMIDYRDEYRQSADDVTLLFS